MKRTIKDNLSNKIVFNRVANLYAKSRPTYPDALFDRLVSVTGLSDSANLLEIGPGTGQATKPLAHRGYKITAIELGEDLANEARKQLEQYPGIDIITGAFEDIELPKKSFELIYSATAFHWIDPSLKYKKPYKLLKDNGYLAIIHTNHISDDHGDAFFERSKPIYSKYYTSSYSSKAVLPKQDSVKPDSIDTDLFELADFSTFSMSLDYTSTGYVELLSTYSPTLALPEHRRQDFLADIARIIDRDFDGKITKYFAMSLTIAKSKPA